MNLPEDIRHLFIPRPGWGGQLKLWYRTNHPTFWSLIIATALILFAIVGI